MDAADVAGRLTVVGAVVVILSGITVLLGDGGSRLDFVMGAIGLAFLAGGAYVRKYGLPGNRG